MTRTHEMSSACGFDSFELIVSNVRQTLMALKTLSFNLHKTINGISPLK